MKGSKEVRGEVEKKRQNEEDKSKSDSEVTLITGGKVKKALIITIPPPSP